jgi:hypothetical protein
MFVLLIRYTLLTEVYRTPDPFGVDIRPRSEKALQAIMLAGEGEDAEKV